MIVILTGAQKNIGDYLIGYRAKKLLEKFVDKEIIELNRFDPLDSNVELINKSKCLLLCGGPAYTQDIYPGIYPLVDDLDKIKVPIIPFGLGWSGKPFRNYRQFKFTPESLDFLKKIHSNIYSSSCRDNITKAILERHDITNVDMTGCPVWYDLKFINKPFIKPVKVKKIVFTTGANVRLFFQTLKLLKIICRKFPEARIYLSFHRGILPDQQTSVRSSLIYIALAITSKWFNTKVVDTSYDLTKIEFYKDCDFHIGYRVHAHLYFLSKRLPSILINEDGRGLGMVETMDLPVFNYNDRSLIKKINQQLSDYIDNNFQDFDKVSEFIDFNFNIMKKNLNKIRNI